MIVNKPEPKSEKGHLNYMAGVSYTVSPLTELQMAAASCFFGEPQYYRRDESDTRSQRTTDGLSVEQRQHLNEMLNEVSPETWRGLSPQQVMEQSIDRALDFDLEATLKLAETLRTDWHIRVTPQVILVRASHHPQSKGTGLIRKYAKTIISRLDEVNTGLAYHFAAYGENAPVPNNLKRAWADRLLRATEYELAKYQQGTRTVKLRDVVRLSGVDFSRTVGLKRLMRNDPTPLKNEQTWEAILSQRGSSRETWEHVIDHVFVPNEERVQNYMALIRNLRNILQMSVSDRHLDKVIAAVQNEQAVMASQQLPFRFYSAYLAVKPFDNPRIEDALARALDISLRQLPVFEGNVMALADNSASATSTMTSAMGTMKISTIANLTAILAARCASREGHIGIFGDTLKAGGIRKTTSVIDQLAEAEEYGEHVGGSTENGIWLFFDRAIQEKQWWDHLFVFSDMQAGHGELYGTDKSLQVYTQKGYAYEGSRYVDVAKLVRDYRRMVNPKVYVYSVQMAGYHDTLIPEFYDRTYILGGWGEGLLRFAAGMIQSQ